jgi:hypothetical protein
MKTTSLLTVALTAAGTAVVLPLLIRRRRDELRDRRVAVCVDLEDLRSAALRGDLGWDRMFELVARHCATHVSLEEITLGRLLASGRVVLLPPARPEASADAVGFPLEMTGDDQILSHLESELATRLPQTRPRKAGAGRLRLVGDLTAIADIGLGFETPLAARIRSHGLEVLPRPVSYPWPEPALIRRSLAQAAAVGRLVAFSGDIVLGHEMHLDVTVDALREYGLATVYFAESRHQKGDWFIAKRLAPRVVVGHRFAPDTLLGLDVHAAVHRWCDLVEEGGIRLCYVDFIRVLHATEPLEGLHYLEHVRQALEDRGFAVSAEVGHQQSMTRPSPDELSLAGMAAGGVAGSAISTVLDLPAALAIPAIAAATAAGALAPRLDEPRTELEASYPPSYAAKALALAVASLAPAGAVGSLRGEPSTGCAWISGIGLNAAAGAILAAVTAGDDYRLRVETYRGLGLDWAVPLAVALRSIPQPRLRWASMAALVAAWASVATRRSDLLARFDAPPPEAHTHHLSAAQRAIGDLALACGPRPVRKWAGLGPAAAAAALRLSGHEQPIAASVAAVLAAIGYSSALTGFRHPERAFDRTLAGTLPSFGAGVAAGAMLLLARRR